MVEPITCSVISHKAIVWIGKTLVSSVGNKLVDYSIDKAIGVFYYKDEATNNLIRMMNSLLGYEMASNQATGFSLLEDAIQAEGCEIRRMLLGHALPWLMKATNLPISEVEKLKLHYHIGSCYALLDERSLSLKWLTSAYETGWSRERVIFNDLFDVEHPYPPYVGFSTYELETLYTYMRPLNTILSASNVKVNDTRNTEDLNAHREYEIRYERWRATHNCSSYKKDDYQEDFRISDSFLGIQP